MSYFLLDFDLFIDSLWGQCCLQWKWAAQLYKSWAVLSLSRPLDGWQHDLMFLEKETWCLFSALSDETIKLAPKRSWPGVNPVMYLVSATETNSQHVSLKLDHGSPSERMKSIMHAKLNPMVCSQELKACVRGKRNIATWCMTFHKWTVHPQLT